MDHIAIMKKSWNFIPKILSGEKSIESRFYMAKFAPWDKIKKGDTIYFKNSGEPISARANVEKVLQFDNLNSDKIIEICNKYGKEIGIKTEKFDKFIALKENKKYCILIYLKQPEAVEPFEINKTGFGNAAAWLCTQDIRKINCSN
jgi:ASC-1-like (ASCH) protein